MIQSFDIGWNDSTAVRQIAYDTDTEELYIEYHSGDVYCYAGVDTDTIGELLDVIYGGHSVGCFVNTSVKGCFPFAYIGNTHEERCPDVFGASASA